METYSDFGAFNDVFKQTFADPYPARVTVLAQLIAPAGRPHAA